VISETATNWFHAGAHRAVPGIFLRGELRSCGWAGAPLVVMIFNLLFERKPSAS
jgi:hypothetical protein